MHQENFSDSYEDSHPKSELHSLKNQIESTDPVIESVIKSASNIASYGNKIRLSKIYKENNKITISGYEITISSEAGTKYGSFLGTDRIDFSKKGNTLSFSEMPNFTIMKYNGKTIGSVNAMFHNKSQNIELLDEKLKKFEKILGDYVGLNITPKENNNIDIDDIKDF